MTVNWEEIYESIAPGVDIDSLSAEEREELHIKARKEYFRIIKEMEEKFGDTILL